VAEFGFGVLADVSLDLFPVAALIADAFARRADRQNACKIPLIFSAWPIMYGARPGSS
jgi:hypothetical protein